ncbi:MAG: sugar transferase [bacterium]
MKRSELFFSVLLIPVDYLALLVAFLLSYVLRDSFSPVSPTNLAGVADRLQYNPDTALVISQSQYLHYLYFIIPGMLVAFALVGLYGIRVNYSWFTRALRILIGVSVGECFILLLFLLRKDFFLPRSTVLYSWALGTLFVIAARLIVLGAQRFLYRFNIGAVRVAVVGDDKAAKRVGEQLGKGKAASYRLVRQFASLPVAQLARHVTREEMDQLVVASGSYSNDDLIELRSICLEAHVAFSFVPSLLSALQSSSFTVQNIADVPMIEVSPTPLEGWGRVLKRLSDLIGGTLLLILFSPLMLLVAISIKLLSPGPLIYRHRRLGRNGTEIKVWKFRSMYWKYCTGVGTDGDRSFEELLATDPKLAIEWEQSHKLKNDPRISIPGRFLRRTSLDELPQLFNVLSGSLSLVGPRPIVEEEIRKYGKYAGLLFSVRPGMTGLWQISGRNDTTYIERVGLDVTYIEHWNLLRDIGIMLRTILVLVGPRKDGAY